MNEAITLIFNGLAGAALGGFFFIGLWWTTQRGIRSTRPVLWFTGGALIRTAVVLSCAYWLAGPNWQYWLALLSGFIIARQLVMIRVKRPDSLNALTIAERGNAP